MEEVGLEEEVGRWRRFLFCDKISSLHQGHTYSKLTAMATPTTLVK